MVTAKWKEAVNGLQTNPRLVGPMIGLLCAVVFCVDFYEPKLVSMATLYAIPLLMSLWVGNRRFTIGLAIVCAVLAIIGVRGEVKVEPDAIKYLYLDRLISIFMMGALATLGVWRMRIERKLFDTREAVTTTLESIADGVITVDTEGRVSFVNPMAERLLELSEHEVIGRPLDAVLEVVDERPQTPPIVELERRRPIASIEGTLVAASGRRRPIARTNSPIRDTDGEVHGHVIVLRDITAQKEHEEAMRRMAYRDELTGLPNRVSLADRFTLEIAHAKRNRELLAVCYLDLDRFKHINDTFGHAVGDQFLKAIADRLRSALRAGDTIARVGGDEFVILVPGVVEESDAKIVARKVLDALAAPIVLGSAKLDAAASIGLALYPRDGTESETLLRRADKAMYQAKQSGGGRVEFASASRRQGTIG